MTETPEPIPGQLALVLAEEGKRLSVDALTDEARRTFDRILALFIDAGGPFSADDLRYALDAAQIPNSARGGLISGALRRGLIEDTGVMVRSTHTATHGKKISVYRRPSEAGAA